MHGSKGANAVRRTLSSRCARALACARVRCKSSVQIRYESCTPPSSLNQLQLTLRDTCLAPLHTYSDPDHAATFFASTAAACPAAAGGAAFLLPAQKQCVAPGALVNFHGHGRQRFAPPNGANAPTAHGAQRAAAPAAAKEPAGHFWQGAAPLENWPAAHGAHALARSE